VQEDLVPRLRFAVMAAGRGPAAPCHAGWMFTARQADEHASVGDDLEVDDAARPCGPRPEVARAGDARHQRPNSSGAMIIRIMRMKIWLKADDVGELRSVMLTMSRR